jgi:hypothetical protein
MGVDAVSRGIRVRDTLVVKYPWMIGTVRYGTYCQCTDVIYDLARGTCDYLPR